MQTALKGIPFNCIYLHWYLCANTHTRSYIKPARHTAAICMRSAIFVSPYLRMRWQRIVLLFSNSLLLRERLRQWERKRYRQPLTPLASCCECVGQAGLIQGRFPSQTADIGGDSSQVEISRCCSLLYHQWKNSLLYQSEDTVAKHFENSEESLSVANKPIKFIIFLHSNQFPEKYT